MTAMKIERRSNGDMAMTMPHDEVAGLRQCLNEVLNGYHIPDFQARIGVAESVVDALLKDTKRHGGIRRTAIDDDCYRLVLTPADCRVLVACMKDTLNGEDLMPSEYQTRVGIEAAEVHAMILQIEAALAGNAPT
jgi:hypothetical protein